VPRGLFGAFAQIGLRFHRDDLGDRGRIVLEVDSVAGAKLDDAPGGAIEHRLAVLAWPIRSSRSLMRANARAKTG
jgi:hypothetical protein